VVYNFQTGINRIKLLKEYENVINKVLLCGINSAECSTASACAPLLSRNMFKRYSISLQEFHSISSVSISIAATIPSGGHSGLANNVLNVSSQEEIM
jgi:hypothetical protein